MSFINDNVLIKYHSDLVINWDSSPKEDYIPNKKNFLELDRILSNIKKDPQRRFHYNNGIFQKALVQYYMLIYSCLNNRTWFQFQNLSLINKYLTQGKKLIDLSEIPWNKIFSVDKTRSTKFDTLISIVDGQLYPILRSLKCLEKEEISFKYNIFKLIFVSQHLNTGGNFIIKMYNYFCCKTLDYLYLLLFFFDSVYIINYSLYMAIGYNPKINVNTEDFFNNLIHRDFTITPKRELPEIIKYLNRSNIGRIETCQLLQKSNINAFIKERHYHYINLLIERNFWTSKNSILNFLPVTKQINMEHDKYDILYYLDTDFQKSLRKKKNSSNFYQ